MPILKRLFPAIAFMSAAAVLPLAAQAFETVASRADFVKLVDGNKLKRTGIALDVSPTGQISGRAFGFDVSGEWQWRDGYFCRSLYWGKQNLGPNCQTVEVMGETIRFTSDRGTGKYADLRIR